MKRALSLLGVAFVVLALMPSADAAGKRVVYVKKTVAVPAFVDPNPGQATATVTCPDGTSPAGGGWTDTSNGQMRIDRTSPSDSFDGWTVIAKNFASSKQSLTVFADCVKLARLPDGATMHFSLQPGSIPPNSTGDVTTGCSSGRKLTGGGYVNGTSAFVGANHPVDGPDIDTDPDDAWRVHFDNLNANTTAQPIILALCVDIAQGLTMSSPEVTDTVDASTPTLAVHCPKGSQVTGGGTDNLGEYNPQKSKPTGLRARLPGTGWSVMISDVTTSTSETVTAACMSIN